MKSYKHSKIVKEISKQTGIHPSVVHIIISRFFDGLRDLMKVNRNINVKGYFRLTMRKSYRRALEKHGPNYVIHRRLSNAKFLRKFRKK